MQYRSRPRNLNGETPEQEYAAGHVAWKAYAAQLRTWAYLNDESKTDFRTHPPCAEDESLAET
jgi:hypothetical protein